MITFNDGKYMHFYDGRTFEEFSSQLTEEYIKAHSICEIPEGKTRKFVEEFDWWFE